MKIIITILSFLTCSCVNNIIETPAYLSKPPMHTWKLYGKIYIKLDGQSFMAKINWQSIGNKHKINILPPSGIHKPFDIDINKNIITINGMEQKFNKYLELSINNINIKVPIKALTYWVQGLVYPEYKYKILKISPNVYFKQNQWEVNLAKFNYDKNLPDMLIISGCELKIKLIIYTWN